MPGQGTLGVCCPGTLPNRHPGGYLGWRDVVDIKWIETKLEPQDPNGEEGGCKLIIQVDRETEIVVYGWGRGHQVIRVRAMEGNGNPDYNPAATIEEAGGDGLWGAALVWATPVTIAHLVMDVINNQ